MLRSVFAGAVLTALVVVLASVPAAAEVDCAQCRAICKARSYPDDIRPDLQSKRVRHRTPEAAAAFNIGMKNDPGLGGKNATLAVAAYKEAVVADPENSQYRNHLAAALLSVKKFDEAVYNLERAIDLVPSEPKYLVNLGYTYHRRGDEQRALVWYMRALMLDPKDVRARLFTGYALEIVGMQEEAAREFRRVLLQDPANDGAILGLKRLGAPVQPPPSPLMLGEDPAGDPPPLVPSGTTKGASNPPPEPLR